MASMRRQQKERRSLRPNWVSAPPPEGADARPSDPNQPERRDPAARIGNNPEREALERISRDATGGGIRFFGSPIPLDGDGIVFVIDRSASMILRVAPPEDAPTPRTAWSKLDLAKWELKKAIAMLPNRTLFNVIFFDDCLDRWRYQLQPAKPLDKLEAYGWIDRIDAQGQSNLSEAVAAAMKEDGLNTIILLSDGRPNVIDCKTMAEAPPSIHKEKIRQSNHENERIWCFGFSEDLASERFLKELTEENGGHYTQVSAKPF